jgi:hypothetical protein
MTFLDVQAWEITCLETMISTNPTGIAIIQEGHLCERLPKCAKGCPSAHNCEKGCLTEQKLPHCAKSYPTVKGCPSARNAVRKISQTERKVA